MASCFFISVDLFEAEDEDCDSFKKISMVALHAACILSGDFGKGCAQCDFRFACHHHSPRLAALPDARYSQTEQAASMLFLRISALVRNEKRSFLSLPHFMFADTIAYILEYSDCSER